MNYIGELFSNRMLMSAFFAWLAAQIIKIIIDAVKEKRFSVGLLFSSGGMPSSHSSAVCALTTTVGFFEGVGSAFFAICVIFSVIVMYDAAGVRRAAGEQEKIINRIVNDFFEGKIDTASKDLKELIGHKPIEVFMGALLGICIGLIFVFVV